MSLDRFTRKWLARTIHFVPTRPNDGRQGESIAFDEDGGRLAAAAAAAAGGGDSCSERDDMEGPISDLLSGGADDEEDAK